MSIRINIWLAMMGVIAWPAACADALFVTRSPLQAPIGQEYRCQELGQACIASEQFDTATYTCRGGGVSGCEHLSADDSTIKPTPYSFENHADVVVEMGAAAVIEDQPVMAGSSSTVWSQLPKKHHSITYYMTHKEGGPNDVFNYGIRLQNTDPVKRVASRIYVYHSPDYELNDMGSCSNSKLLQSKIATEPGSSLIPILDIYGNAAFSGSSFRHHMYQWRRPDASERLAQYDDGGIIDAEACCQWGPPHYMLDDGNPPFGPSETVPWVGSNSALEAIYQGMDTALQGKWWRFEFVVVEREAPTQGHYMVVYARNVSDDGPEFRLTDTRLECDPSLIVHGATTNCYNTYDGADNNAQGFLGESTLRRKSGNTFQAFNWTMHRSGTCNGYRAVSHMMHAGWNTDTGQRIGSAFEMEGSSGTFGEQ